MKDLLLKILTRVWTIGIPLVLCASFFVAIYFCMFDIWGWSKLVSAIVSIILFVLTTILMGKLFRLF